MTPNRKARYSNGILTPLEPLDLEDGAEVFISIDAPLDTPSEERVKTILSLLQEAGKGARTQIDSYACSTRLG